MFIFIIMTFLGIWCRFVLMPSAYSTYIWCKEVGFLYSYDTWFFLVFTFYATCFIMNLISVYHPCLKFRKRYLLQRGGIFLRKSIYSYIWYSYDIYDYLFFVRAYEPNFIINLILVYPPSLKSPKWDILIVANRLIHTSLTYSSIYWQLA